MILPAGGETLAGLRALATPGHAADHVCFLTGDGVCFAGDLVLGLGSTIVPPGGGSLAAYMGSLRPLQAEDLALICPGHGPWITDPAAKLAEYLGHREDARAQPRSSPSTRGERSRAALLAAAWDDVPAELLPMAAMAMESHLEKLEGEGRLAWRTLRRLSPVAGQATAVRYLAIAKPPPSRRFRRGDAAADQDPALAVEQRLGGEAVGRAAEAGGQRALVAEAAVEVAVGGEPRRAGRSSAGACSSAISRPACRSAGDQESRLESTASAASEPSCGRAN